MVDFDRFYFREVQKFEKLSEKEEKKLYLEIKSKDKKAREKILDAHLLKVIMIAEHYWRPGLGIELMDLIGEGNIGLLKAIDNFNEKKGAKFGTYAGYWIEKQIKGAILKRKIGLEIPDGMHYEIKKLQKVLNEFKEKRIENPRLKAIAKKIGKTQEQTQKILDLLKRSQLPLKFLSLDKTIDDDEETTLIDVLISPESSQYEIMDNHLKKEKTLKLINSLPKLEAEIIKRRYGFYQNRRYSYEEIGKKLKISTGKILRLEEDALSKLKKSIKEEKI